MKNGFWLTPLILILTATPASAGTQDSAVLAIHTTLPAKGQNPCDGVTGYPCRLFNVHVYSNGGFVAYVVVANADSAAGVAGTSLGVDASNIAIDSWGLCADTETPSAAWPQPGGGNTIAWSPQSNCQRTVVEDGKVQTLAGFFMTWTYDGDGFLELTPNPAASEPALTVADCAGVGSTLHTAGAKIGLGNVAGFNPCLSVTPVDHVTWGRIKSQYR